MNEAKAQALARLITKANDGRAWALLAGKKDGDIATMSNAPPPVMNRLIYLAGEQAEANLAELAAKPWGPGRENIAADAQASADLLKDLSAQSAKATGLFIKALGWSSWLYLGGVVIFGAGVAFNTMAGRWENLPLQLAPLLWAFVAYMAIRGQREALKRAAETDARAERQMIEAAEAIASVELERERLAALAAGAPN